MLTPDDSRSDGKFTQYLNAPEKWRKYDPDLFDFLEDCIKGEQARNVNRLRNASILPATKFYSDILFDDVDKQSLYFNEMFTQFKTMDLIFFDPDNGIEIKSKKRGQKNSCKFLYWDQLIQAYKENHSVLIYQHFVRENRDEFIKRLTVEINNKTGAKKIYSFKTSNVVFFLASQANHIKRFEQNIKRIPDAWENQIALFQHKALV